DVDDGWVNPLTGNHDHVVSAYAAGGLFVLRRLAMEETGLVDLRQTGRSFAGAVFTGFTPNEQDGLSPAVMIPTYPVILVRSPLANEMRVWCGSGADARLIFGGVAGIDVAGDLLAGRYIGTFSLSSVGLSDPLGIPGVRFGDASGAITSAAAFAFSNEVFPAL